MICDLIGHKFRPRYSVANPALQTFLTQAIGPIALGFRTIEVMQDKKYECDICERCGKIMSRLIK